MTDKTPAELLALAAKLERASGQDRELDRLIADALGVVIYPAKPDPYAWLTMIGDAWFEAERQSNGYMTNRDRYVPRYTGSVDTALSLIPEGFTTSVTHWHNGRGLACTWSDDVEEIKVRAATPALAIVAAALRARAGDER